MTKHLTTLLALLLSCSMLAQGPVEFPWNPDADGDDFIGVNDLMALLGEYSTSFSEENLYLADDSLSATYYVGDGLNYFECQQACRTLPGQWKMPSLSEVNLNGAVHFGWVSTPDAQWEWDNYTNSLQPWLFWDGELADTDVMLSNNAAKCHCFTKQIPKVEYFLCSTDQPEQLQTCVSDKVGDGWILLGAPMWANQSGHAWNQALWRWAE